MDLLLLALEAALYPTLLAAVVILLATERPIRLLSAYLAGGLTISIGLGVAIVLLVGDSGALDNQRAALSWAADLTVGGLALLVAVALATRTDERLRRARERRRAAKPGSKPQPEPADEREPWSQRLLARGNAPVVFLAAMAINVPGAAYLIALKDIAAGSYSAGTAVLLIVGFNLIMFMLAEIPLLGLVLAPDRTRALVHRADAWLSGHGRQIAIGLCVVLGTYLVVRGISHA